MNKDGDGDGDEDGGKVKMDKVGRRLYLVMPRNFWIGKDRHWCLSEMR